jgi:hypothetical protein
VRGNRRTGIETADDPGTIPARAGKPRKENDEEIAK